MKAKASPRKKLDAVTSRHLESLLISILNVTRISRGKVIAERTHTYVQTISRVNSTIYREMSMDLSSGAFISYLS